MAQTPEDVYCTLLMSDSYLPGAAVLAHSLRDAGTTKKLAVLVTLETLAEETVTQLRALYDYIIPVDRIRTPRPANLFLMGRPDLSFTFTKIALWKQTQFRKIVYLDADVVALRALDELFDIEAPFAAAPDIGWPDAFNSGVMVLNPDMGEYEALQAMAASGDSFDGADQGLLNQYFENRPWQRLKFTYNCTPNAEYQWEPAYQHYKKDISAVHFIGKEKPWSGSRSTGHGVYGELLSRWWAVYNKHKDDPSMQWDATKSGPPSKSKPEAANFPNATYEFSDSQKLFKAPSSYPEPPRDMGYKLPENTEAPKPIFPWEQDANRPKPTRVWAEDSPQSSTPVAGSASPAQSAQTQEEKSADYQQSGDNAWDKVPGIDNYVRAIMNSQNRRGSVQVLQQATGTEDIASPQPQSKSQGESLIITDFPSDIERPSLPVTPAPIRRDVFRGNGENDEGSELPTAEGVPEQSAWNPEAQLEHLRRSSLVEFQHLKNDEHPNPPLRALPEHSVLEDKRPDPVATRTWTDWTSRKNSFAGRKNNKGGFTMSDFGTKFGKNEKSNQKSSWRQTTSKQESNHEGFSSTFSTKSKVGFTMSDFGTKFGKDEKSTQQSSLASQYESQHQDHSSSFSPDSTPTEHSFTIIEETSDGRFKAGELLFTMPTFVGGSSALLSPTDNDLSPMTTRDERRESEHSF